MVTRTFYTDYYRNLSCGFLRAIVNMHFALFGGRKCVLERSLCGA